MTRLSDQTNAGQGVADWPAVSIIIPCYNKAEYTERCLAALYENTPAARGYEIVLVDNASTDGTKALLERHRGAANVRIVSNPMNLGFAKACNQGAAAARAPRLLFLNNDTEPLPGWLEPMLGVLESDEQVGVVGSKLLYADGRVQHAGMVLDECNAGEMLHFDHLYRFVGPDVAWVNREREVLAVTGACYLIRRDIFQAVGGFNENYRNGYEDVDLSLKVREAGYRIVYCPRSVLYHHESASHGRYDHEDANQRLLDERWHGRVKPDRARRYAEDGRTEMSELVALVAQLRAHLSPLHRFVSFSARPKAPDLRHRVRYRISNWFRRRGMPGPSEVETAAVHDALITLYYFVHHATALLDRVDATATCPIAAATGRWEDAVSTRNGKDSQPAL